MSKYEIYRIFNTWFFGKSRGDSNNLLQVTANKTRTWISWKWFSCNWCGIRQLHLFFMWVLISCLDVAKFRHSVVWQVHRTLIVTTNYGNESFLHCQFFFSPVLGEWLSRNDAECCVFSLIQFFRLTFVPSFHSRFLFGFFCVLFNWQVCLFFPHFLKEIWGSYFLRRSLFWGIVYAAS